MRGRGRALVVCALAVGLVATGCTKHAGNSAPPPAAGIEVPITIDKLGRARTPAAGIPGAKSGGTLFWLETAAPAHLDPQQIHASDAQAIDAVLFRHLTNYIDNPKDIPTLVGDLATNTGETPDGGKTWTYHLRDGITFEDGAPITSKDIAYGIARSFGTYGERGPHDLQNALDPNRRYTGPGAGDPPGITTPDPRTITFTFPRAHPEMPFLAALPTTTPVPKSKDSGATYDAQFVASGPYMRDGVYDQTTKLTLKKNPNWDPRTDPIRHQYVDSFVFDFQGGSREVQTDRLMADQGDDQFAVATAAVSQSQIGKVQGDPALLARTGQAATAAMDYININTSRVTDVKVRQALNWAFDRGAYVTALGGPAVAGPATWIMAPTTPGFKAYNAYPSADGDGDVDRARTLLAGQTPKLTYCFANTPTQARIATVAQGSLQRAGFQITLKPIDPGTYATTIGQRDNACDLMRGGWDADYPDGKGTLDVLLNGRYIVAKGNPNHSLFNEPSINAELDALSLRTDRDAAAKDYGELDQEIMSKFAPLIPTYNTRFFNLHGSKAHAWVSSLFPEFNLVSAWVG